MKLGPDYWLDVFCFFQFTVPGSSLLLSPKIYVTVIAYTPLASLTTQQVSKIHHKSTNISLFTLYLLSPVKYSPGDAPEVFFVYPTVALNLFSLSSPRSPFHRVLLARLKKTLKFYRYPYSGARVASPWGRPGWTPSKCEKAGHYSRVAPGE